MKIACAQLNVSFNDPNANADQVICQLGRLKQDGVDLVIFPEAFLTGYCVGSMAEAERIAIRVTVDAKGEVVESHESLERIRKFTNDLEVGCIVGFAGSTGSELYNGAILFEPGRTPRQYMKTHLPYLGYDRFAKTGNALDVFETKWGRIGILICFDARPPEAARTLALKGADLIVLPTNWPIGAEVSANHVGISRAAENKVFFASCNRVGVENGTQFIGLSKIIHCSGRVLAAAGADEEVIVAEIDLLEARQKRIVNIPGEYEMEVFGCRKPDLYRIIGEQNQQ